MQRSLGPIASRGLNCSRRTHHTPHTDVTNSQSSAYDNAHVQSTLIQAFTINFIFRSDIPFLKTVMPKMSIKNKQHLPRTENSQPALSTIRARHYGLEPEIVLQDITHILNKIIKYRLNYFYSWCSYIYYEGVVHSWIGLSWTWYNAAIKRYFGGKTKL